MTHRGAAPAGRRDARSGAGGTERGLTLANVAERSGLNVGYLSQIENDKASPSLELPDVASPPRSTSRSPGSSSTRCPRRWSSARADRPIDATELGRIEHVDGGASRDVSIVEVVAPSGRPRRRSTPMPATSITSCCAAGSG